MPQHLLRLHHPTHHGTHNTLYNIRLKTSNEMPSELYRPRMDSGATLSTPTFDNAGKTDLKQPLIYGNNAGKTVDIDI
jgi:hypothetical protein